MRRAWICLLGVVGIVTTSCLGFTVERSIAGPSSSRKNWTAPIYDLERRASIEKFFNGIHSVDIENILRDSEPKDVAKLPDEKCSSSSENPQRAKRSETVLGAANHSTVAEKNLSEPKDPMTAAKIVAVPKELTIPEKGVMGPKKSTIPEKNIFDSKESTNTKKIFSEPDESTIAEKNVSVPKKSTIAEKNVSGPKESTTFEKIVSESKVSTIDEKNAFEPKKSTLVSSSSMEMKTSQITSEMSMDSETPRNVVLLLIDDAETGRENFFKHFEAVQKFPVKGFLQNCRSDKFPGSNRFSLGESPVSEKRKDECECDRFLRANVGSLLSWARHLKEMTTGAVSTTNFSIPSSLGYEASSSQLAKEFEDNDEMNGFRQESSRFTSDPKDNSWRLMDTERQSLPSAAALVSIGSSSKQDATTGYDGMWDVFDMFSRIRIAFFRILLESLGNMTGTDDDFTGRKTFTVQPSLVDLVTDAIRELKSVPNDKGFVLVAAAPGNELSAAVDVLQREISTKETLLVVAGICSTTNDPVPFFAHGPGEKWLWETRTIWDLPGSIRSAMSNGCQDDSCKNERREEPQALPSLGAAGSSLTRPHSQDVPHKRVIRAKAEEGASESSAVGKTSKASENDSVDNKSFPEARAWSGAENIQVDNVARILGIVTSIAAMIAIN